MSGHSKWATIKRKKGALDAARGQMFTKLIKEISIAAKMGGGDPEGNARLKAAILKAKAANMPKDNIERAIKKGAGELEGAEYFEITYEAYGPNGVGLIIETLTDNKNRTAADIRYILNKYGGSLGTTGSVSYLFKKKGILEFDAQKYTEDQILDVALEAGAEDVRTEDGVITVTTAPEDFERVFNAISERKLEQEMAQVTLLPDTWVKLEGEALQRAQTLIEKLEENDDVQNVYHNLELPDDEGE